MCQCMCFSQLLQYCNTFGLSSLHASVCLFQLVDHMWLNVKVWKQSILNTSFHFHGLRLMLLTLKGNLQKNGKLFLKMPSVQIFLPLLVWIRATYEYKGQNIMADRNQPFCFQVQNIVQHLIFLLSYSEIHNCVLLWLINVEHVIFPYRQPSIYSIWIFLGNPCKAKFS